MQFCRFDADPDPTFHIVVDPNPGPTLSLKMFLFYFYSEDLCYGLTDPYSDPYSDPDPALFDTDLHNANKKYCVCRYITSFFKDKKS
jgi:hypothetical protein